MDASIIRHSLDLAVRLVDTTTGFVVEEGNVQFQKNGEIVRPNARGSGNYVFTNCGRENCTLDIKVYGYENCRISVRYEDLDSLVPVQDAFLIPLEDMVSGQQVVSFSGRLSGLEDIQAVYSGPSVCGIGGYDEKKQIMTLIGNFSAESGGVHYGLIHVGSGTYEPFLVQEQLSRSSIKTVQPLLEPFSPNAPISRIVFGKSDQDGNYCIRVRDDSSNLKYIIRYVVKGKVKYREVDFHSLENEALD